MGTVIDAAASVIAAPAAATDASKTGSHFTYQMPPSVVEVQPRHPETPPPRLDCWTQNRAAMAGSMPCLSQGTPVAGNAKVCAQLHTQVLHTLAASALSPVKPSCFHSLHVRRYRLVQQTIPNMIVSPVEPCIALSGEALAICHHLAAKTVQFASGQ